jgi:hypothetical protein
MRESNYERISRRLLHSLSKPKKYCRVWEGRLICGTQSLHRSRSGCRYRMFWRIKSLRIILTKIDPMSESV